MSLLDKEPVKRAEKFLKEFDQSLEVTINNKSAHISSEVAKNILIR